MPDNPNFPPERLAALKEAGKNTQIGKPGAGTTPGLHGGNQPHSIAKSLRYLGAQPLKQGAKTLEGLLPPEPSMNQIIAANLLAKAAKGDAKSVEICLDRIDGKVVQPIQELPPAQPYRTDFVTEEEADEAYRQACKS